MGKGGEKKEKKKGSDPILVEKGVGSNFCKLEKGVGSNFCKLDPTPFSDPFFSFFFLFPVFKKDC
jgi:hypothetical protein